MHLSYQHFFTDKFSMEPIFFGHPSLTKETTPKISLQLLQQHTYLWSVHAKLQYL